MGTSDQRIAAKTGTVAISAMSPSGAVATWFGSGLLPGAPGTWGSLAALPAAWLLSVQAGPLGLLVGVAIIFALGLWAAGACLSGDPATNDDNKDPGAIVIDEVAGQWLTLTVVSPGLIAYAIGFLFFRLFDILKPWPVSWADRELKGAFGVMADDILAGIFAAAATWTTIAGLNAMGVTV